MAAKIKKWLICSWLHMAWRCDSMLGTKWHCMKFDPCFGIDKPMSKQESDYFDELDRRKQNAQ